MQNALVTAKRYADTGNQSILSSANAYTDRKLTDFTTTGDFDAFRDQVNQLFHTVNTRLDRVGAMGSALSGMAGAIAAAPNTQNRICAAVGGYGGQGELAVGYSYRFLAMAPCWSAAPSRAVGNPAARWV